MINYTVESKSKSKHRDNYTENSKDAKVYCHACIYVGDYVGNNERLAMNHLCAKYIDEISEVKHCGTCDRALAACKWYNTINPIKKLLLAQANFKFKNR